MARPDARRLTTYGTSLTTGGYYFHIIKLIATQTAAFTEARQTLPIITA